MLMRAECCVSRGARKKMAAMTEDKNIIVAQNRAKCICPSCPTYNECMRADDQRLFCVTGRSPTCTFDKKGCLCPACPVTKVLGLKRFYYCLHGSEEEQQ
jgi:Protein of unknown function (DUF2769)